MAIDNCDWYEVITFNRSGHHELDHLELRADRTDRIDADGMVHAPKGPGLGYDNPWGFDEGGPNRRGG